MLIFLSFMGGIGICCLMTIICEISEIRTLLEELEHERKNNIMLEKIYLELRDEINGINLVTLEGEEDE